MCAFFSTFPDVGESVPAIILSRVDLPVPLSPTIQIFSCSVHLKETASRMVFSKKVCVIFLSEMVLIMVLNARFYVQLHLNLAYLLVLIQLIIVIAKRLHSFLSSYLVSYLAHKSFSFLQNSPSSVGHHTGEAQTCCRCGRSFVGRIFKIPAVQALWKALRSATGASRAIFQQKNMRAFQRPVCRKKAQWIKLFQTLTFGGHKILLINHLRII